MRSFLNVRVACPITFRRWITCVCWSAIVVKIFYVENLTASVFEVIA